MAALMPTERTTTVSGIDRCVGLDEVLIGEYSYATAFLADDSHGNAAAEAERGADGYDYFTHPQLIGIAYFHRMEVHQSVVGNLEDREIGVVIVTDKFGLYFGFIVEDDLDRVSVLHYVVTGKYVSLGAYYNARTLAGQRAGYPVYIPISEAACHLILHRLGAHNNHRRHCTFDNVGYVVTEHPRHAGRYGLVCGDDHCKERDRHA